MSTELSERERAIMNEAFDFGRIFNKMGEPAGPAEIYKKLERKCIAIAKAAPSTDSRGECEHVAIGKDMNDNLFA